jgi:hypothetical protein
MSEMWDSDSEEESQVFRVRKAWRHSVDMLIDQQSNQLGDAIPQYESRHKRRVVLDDLWLELRSRWLHCVPVQDEMDFLTEKQSKFLEFVQEIERFHMDSRRGQDPRQVVEHLLEEYDRFCSYFPSQKKMVEHFSSVVTAFLINRIGVLQRWLRFSELMDICLQDIHFLIKNNKFYQRDVPLTDQPDDFFLLIREDEQLRLCYQKYLDRDVGFLFPKIQKIYDSNKRDFDQFGLPLREKDLLFMVSSAPYFQIYGFSAHVNHLQKFKLGNCTPEKEKIVLFILERMRTITEIRAQFFENKVIEWMPLRYILFPDTK